jgi:hypothetical protein
MNLVRVVRDLLCTCLDIGHRRCQQSTNHPSET